MSRPVHTSLKGTHSCTKGHLADICLTWGSQGDLVSMGWHWARRQAEANSRQLQMCEEM